MQAQNALFRPRRRIDDQLLFSDAYASRYHLPEWLGSDSEKAWLHWYLENIHHGSDVTSF